MTMRMGSIARVVAVAAALVSVSAIAAPVFSLSDSTNITGIHVTVTAVDPSAVWDAGVADVTSNSILGDGTESGWWRWLGGPDQAIDGNLGTKALAVGSGDAGRVGATKGVGTGFYITPSIGATVVTGFQMATADDGQERDPMTIALQGSNSTGTDLLTGSNWTPIYSGTTGLPTSRQTWGPEQDFANSASFTSYRMIVTSQRAVQMSTAYSEVQLFTAVPEPASLGLLGLMSVGLLTQRRRKA